MWENPVLPLVTNPFNYINSKQSVFCVVTCCVASCVALSQEHKKVHFVVYDMGMLPVASSADADRFVVLFYALVLQMFMFVWLI